MALTTDFTEIRRRVGIYVGFHRDPTEWDAGETAVVTDIISAGLRMFYFPTSPNLHSWSFLKKEASIAFAIGENWVDAPTDFVRLASAVSMTGSDRRLEVVDESEIRLKITNESETGDPVFVAFRNKIGESPTVYEVGVYPTPAASKTIVFRYLRDPDTVSSGSPNPAGGADHSETIIAACMAAADIILNPEKMNQEQGSFAFQRFNGLLEASITFDAALVGGQAT